jgi:catechol 2,3-dioxygenase-like lactoylglutathione lyase family enzyme
MTIRLNHTIVAAHDRDASAIFLTDVLGLPPPSVLGPFAAVQVGDTTLDYMDVREYLPAAGELTPQHYAFLVSEIEFDEIFARIRDRRLTYWADPGHQERDQINTWDDGRAVYFDDPNGHVLEILTRPYGSAGTSASRPHPLIMHTLERPDDDSAHEEKEKDHRRGLVNAERPVGATTSRFESRTTISSAPGSSRS